MQVSAKMEMGITEFYEKKTVLVTVGSGLLGRVIIEKLLRSTNVSCIYVLIRRKRQMYTQDRIKAWTIDPLFSLLLETKPNAFDRVVAISGDCKEPDLGLSFKDRELLKRETHVVIHSAATVNFSELLFMALDTNTRGTRLMLQLAREMTHLLAFVHVSTAFSNCLIHHLEERFYPNHLSCSADTVLKIRELCDIHLLEGMEKMLMGKFPNTYTYTKALAEQVIQKESAGMPVCVFRPGAIVATSKEPMPGWMDKIYGPIGMVYGCAMGILRVAPVNRNALSTFAPVDYCANLVLASAWKTAKENAGRSSLTTPVDPTVYNFVPHDKNLITNGGFWNLMEKYEYDYPLTQSMWYPYLFVTSIHWLYKAVAFFLHLLPGFTYDIVLELSGELPRMMELYNNVHKTFDELVPFSVHNWSFETINADRLWQDMSEADRRLFQFDMRSLDWHSYVAGALAGMRKYLAKEDPGEECIKIAQRHYMSRYRRHCFVLFVVIGVIIATLKWTSWAFFYINRNYNMDRLL